MGENDLKYDESNFPQTCSCRDPKTAVSNFWSPVGVHSVFRRQAASAAAAAGAAAAALLPPAVCEKFHNDRMRNNRSTSNGKSDNKKKKKKKKKEEEQQQQQQQDFPHSHVFLPLFLPPPANNFWTLYTQFCAIYACFQWILEAVSQG